MSCCRRFIGTRKRRLPFGCGLRLKACLMKRRSLQATAHFNGNFADKLDWVIVRPVILTDGPKTTAYRAVIDPRDWTWGFISRADVADFLVKQIDDGAMCGR
jgi:NAD(P)H-binding